MFSTDFHRGYKGVYNGRMDVTSNFLQHLLLESIIFPENKNFRSNFGQFLGQIFQKLITGGDVYSGLESTSGPNRWGRGSLGGIVITIEC